MGGLVAYASSDEDDEVEDVKVRSHRCSPSYSESQSLTHCLD